MSERAISEMTDEEILEYVNAKRAERDTRRAEAAQKKTPVKREKQEKPEKPSTNLSAEELNMMRAILGITNES